jgi:hypothetical protein
LSTGYERAIALARRLVLGLSSLWLVALVVVFSLRIGFPLELEWMEGGSLQQALRMQSGEAVYGPPSPEFVPFLYTPLYSMVLAVLGHVFPLDYALGRVVSVLAFVAICVGLWRAVGWEGRPVAHQAAAVGLLCAGYVFSFRWLDLARPDTLFVALVLWGLVLLRESKGSHRRAVAAGVLVALAFWTKQTAAIFVIASALGALFVARRQLWSYALTIAVIDGGGVLLGNALTNGWLWTYIYELHQSHPFNHERFTTKTWGMFTHAAPFIVVLVAGLVVSALRPWLRRARRRGSQETADDDPPANRGLAYWAVMALAALVASALAYSTLWAEPNAFIPGVCFGALLVAVALPVGGRGELLALGMVSAQLVFAFVVEPMYHPIQTRGLRGLGLSYRWQDLARTIPTADQRKRAADLRVSLESAPGEVFALHRPWWNVIAGGSGHVGSMGVHDVEAEDRRRLRRAVRADVARVRYDQVWLEGEPPSWLRDVLARGYRLQRRLHGEDRVRPLTGYMSKAGMVTPYVRDQLLFVPTAQREPPDGGRVIADFEDGTLQGFECKGGAFWRRPTTGFHGRFPVVGPHGGRYLLSGIGRPRGRGSTVSPPFSLDGSAVELLVGATKVTEKLSVEIVEEGGAQRVIDLPLPQTRFNLAPLRWEIPPGMRGAIVRLRLRDVDPRAAMFMDDLWLVP